VSTYPPISDTSSVLSTFDLRSIGGSQPLQVPVCDIQHYQDAQEQDGEAQRGRNVSLPMRIAGKAPWIREESTH